MNEFMMNRYDRMYREHCRSCGAHLGGDKSKDWGFSDQLPILVTYYTGNAMGWAILAFFTLGLFIAALTDHGLLRQVLLGMVLVAGATFGLFRGHAVRARGEMFQKKKKIVMPR